MEHKVDCHNDVVTSTSTNKLTNPGPSSYYQLLPKLQANFDSYVNCDKNTLPATDYLFTDKDKGFLLLEPGNFKFVDPDGELVTITGIDQYIDIANIIRQTDRPNYQQARYPLNSGLNLDKWEYYCRDYRFRKLIQYLRFRFPLSMKDPDTLKKDNVVNYFSAIQYPQEVT